MALSIIQHYTRYSLQHFPRNAVAYFVAPSGLTAAPPPTASLE